MKADHLLDFTIVCVCVFIIGRLSTAVLSHGEEMENGEAGEREIMESKEPSPVYTQYSEIW